MDCALAFNCFIPELSYVASIQRPTFLPNSERAGKCEEAVLYNITSMGQMISFLQDIFIPLFICVYIYTHMHMYEYVCTHICICADMHVWGGPKMGLIYKKLCIESYMFRLQPPSK